MSRAFTKEDDAGDDLIERPIPPGPNYMTPRGIELMKAWALELANKKKSAKPGEDLRPVERDLRYIEARVNSAIVVPPGSGAEARFGALVTYEQDGKRATARIVGEDEARSGADLLAWSSPLAQAMYGAKAGDEVSWDGPESTVRLKILSVDW